MEDINNINQVMVSDPTITSTWDALGPLEVEGGKSNKMWSEEEVSPMVELVFAYADDTSTRMTF
jgi:hypothetical protein